jgi:hypothetical protein
MTKKVSDSQEAGYVGENEFRSWAAKMGWFPSNLVPDHGIDFVCQIRGDRIGEKTSSMPGRFLNVSVRSTTVDSDSATIYRSDAQLLLSTSVPMVFALVRRAPLGEAGEVAIKFPDEDFIGEIEAFLKGPAQSHSVRFSDAISDIQEIQQNVEKLFQQSHKDMIARLLAEHRLKELIKEPQAEILHTANGTVVYVHSKVLGSQPEIFHRADVVDALQDIGMKVVFTPSSLIPSQNLGVIGARGDLGFAASEEYHHPSLQVTTLKSGQANHRERQNRIALS